VAFEFARHMRSRAHRN